MPSRPPSRPRPDCLTPPNGCRGVGDHAGVQAQHAGLEAFAHPDAPVQVPGEDVGHQPVLGVVRQPDGLVLGAEGDDRGDGSEDFLGQDPGALGDALEDGGLVEVARALDGGAADHRDRTGGHGIGDQLVDLVPALRIDQRADLGLRLGAAGGGHVRHLRGELLRELIRDGLVHDEPVRGRAGLAHVPQLRQHRPGDGGVDVGVLEHHERGVAAELHRGPQHRSPTRPRAAGGPPRWSR